jgi:hypothetical protein
MISATWPMPDSYVPSVRNNSESFNNHLQNSSLIKEAISTLNQKKGEVNEVFLNLTEFEKQALQKYLDKTIKKLSSKLSNKAVSLQFQVTTHDLDDVYDPQGKLPFPKNQASLFEGTKWDPSEQDEPF